MTLTPTAEERPDGSPNAATTATVCRAGVVSFLNSRPLLDGLDRLPGWRLTPAVPSALADQLRRGEIDVALLPVVDYRANRDIWEPISDGCIGCDGETMTVRVFSKAPPDRIRRLEADPDSHTSVILAQVVWRELFGQRLAIVARGARSDEFRDDQDAILLIGDKVVTDRPRGFGFEVDLGAAWKHWTGLPMVFATWVCPRGRWNDAERRDVAAALSAARDRGVARAADIAARDAAPHGWPVELARHYLETTLRFKLDDRMQAGLRRFLEEVDRLGL